MTNYISYIDTDSVFIKLNQYLIDQKVDINLWNNLDKKTKIHFLLKLSKEIESVINNKSYNYTQLQDYNSIITEDDFSIKLKQEIICSNMLHIGPKMYAYHVINEEGYNTNKIDAKGIEIVRSSSPTIFRKSLKDILERLLKGDSDDQLNSIVKSYKNEFYYAKPEDISVNIGVNGLEEYISSDNTYKKGTPYHIKSVAHYHCLLHEFDIEYKYEQIKEGDKIKVVYIKKNPWGFETIGYYKFPNEFLDKGLSIDYDKMIEKYFTNKVKILFDPINRSSILNDNTIENLFF
jgi:DNA polymerase elongation subunit (family B)